MVTGQDVVAEARTFLGTRYHHLGRLRGVGVDCAGLVQLTGRNLGVMSHDAPSYSPSGEGGVVIRELDLAAERIDLEEAGVGDILTFWIKRVGVPVHIGILTPLGLLHTHASVGKVVEHVLDDRWAKRIVGAYRYRGVVITDRKVRGWRS